MYLSRAKKKIAAVLICILLFVPVNGFSLAPLAFLGLSSSASQIAAFSSATFGTLAAYIGLTSEDSVNSWYSVELSKNFVALNTAAAFVFKAFKPGGPSYTLEEQGILEETGLVIDTIDGSTSFCLPGQQPLDSNLNITSYGTLTNPDRIQALYDISSHYESQPFIHQYEIIGIFPENSEDLIRTKIEADLSEILPLIPPETITMTHPIPTNTVYQISPHFPYTHSDGVTALISSIGLPYNNETGVFSSPQYMFPPNVIAAANLATNPDLYRYTFEIIDGFSTDGLDFYKDYVFAASSDPEYDPTNNPPPPVKNTPIPVSQAIADIAVTLSDRLSSEDTHSDETDRFFEFLPDINRIFNNTYNDIYNISEFVDSTTLNEIESAQNDLLSTVAGAIPQSISDSVIMANTLPTSGTEITSPEMIESLASSVADSVPATETAPLEVNIETTLPDSPALDPDAPVSLTDETITQRLVRFKNTIFSGILISSLTTFFASPTPPAGGFNSVLCVDFGTSRVPYLESSYGWGDDICLDFADYDPLWHGFRFIFLAIVTYSCIRIFFLKKG